MHPPLPVALIGFSDFERRALGSYFRLAAPPALALELVREPAAARVLVADGSQADTLRQVAALGRLAVTVFIGGDAPAGAAARLPRPIDALLVLRAIESLAQALPQPPAAGAAAIELPAAVRRHGPSFSALLVDDSAIALRFLQLRLQRMGIDSDLAHGSARALELLAQRAYGFVFIDVELGDGSALDGLALCQHIRRQHRHVGGRAPVLVMVSAHHSAVDRARGAFAGCDHYLAKPADDEALRQLLSQHRPGPARKALSI
jgi:CheY-like chemotaxis protein